MDRSKTEKFDEFEGVVEDVILEPSNMDVNKNEQYHISVKPIDKMIKGKTGLMHEWIRIPATATESSIPEESVIDKYIQQLEIIMPEVAKVESHVEIFNSLKGKKLKFKKLKLGKSYDRHDAKEYWTPIALVE